MQFTAEQFDLLKKQLNGLKERSPFYARKFEGIDMADVQTQADFEKLPFSEKADLREAYPLGDPGGSRAEEVVRIHSSSGTTGTPVIIPYTQQDVLDWAEMFARCYETAGITNKDRIRLRRATVCGRPASAFSLVPNVWEPWPFPWVLATPRSSSR